MENHQQDLKLFEELYNYHPQAIIWMTPVWEEASGQITDFMFSYVNDEGLNYLALPREQVNGMSIMRSPSVDETLRVKIF